MTREEYKSEMIKFLGEEGLNYLKEFYDKGELMLPWGSFLYGRVGMQVRNHLTIQHPEILDNFSNWNAFEDFSTELIEEILENFTPKTDSL